MKNVTGLLIALLLLAHSAVWCQQPTNRFEVKGYVGYGFVAPGSFKAKSSRPLSNDSTYFKVDNDAMGLGLRFGAGLGYIVREFLVVGVEAEYLSGKLDQTVVQQSGSFSLNAGTTINYAILSIMPNVKFQTVGSGRFSFYNRLGLIIGVPLHLEENHHSVSAIKSSNYEQWTTYNYEAAYTLKTGLGYQAAIGFQTKITGDLSACLEVTGYGLTLKRDKYEELKAEKELAEGRPGEVIVGDTDHSRNIILYADKGVNRPTVTGSGNQKITTFTHPQDPVNCNAITINLGLVFAW